MLTCKLVDEEMKHLLLECALINVRNLSNLECLQIKD